MTQTFRVQTHPSSVDPWAALDTLADGVAILDTDGKICYVNHSWQQQVVRSGIQFRCHTGMHYLSSYQIIFELCNVNVQSVSSALHDLLNGHRSHIEFSYVEQINGQSHHIIVTILPYASATMRGALVQHRETPFHQTNILAHPDTNHTEPHAGQVAHEHGRLLIIAQHLLTKLALDDVLYEIQRALSDLLPYDGLLLYLLDEQTHALRLKLQVEPDARVYLYPKTHSIPLKRGLAITVFHTQQGHIASPTPPDGASPYPEAELLDCRHLMGIPLQPRGHATGVLIVGRASNHPFTSEDLERAYLFGNYAALALDNASMIATMQHRTIEFDLLMQAGMEMTRELDLPPMLRTIVETTAQVFGYERVGLHLIEGEEIVLYHHIGYPQIFKRLALTEGIIGRVARTGRPVLLKDAQRDPAFLGSRETRAEVCVPLFDAGLVIGVLNVETTGDTTLSADDLRLLNMLATKASIAIERARLYTQIRKREQQYHSIVISVKEVIFQTDLAGHWTFLNPAWIESTGFLLGETIGKHFLDFIHPDDQPYAAREFALLIEGKKPSCRYETRYISQSKDLRWIEMQAWPVTGPDQTITGTSGILNDITERKASEERLQRLALYDMLTGLPNRVFLLERLQAVIDQSCRNPTQKFAILFLDLDNFKLVNDSLGHLAGDDFLKEITVRLNRCIRADDVVARLGGDEFTILLEHIDQPGDAIEVADRIQEALAEPFHLSGHELLTTASIGIALGSMGYDQAQDLLRDADTAMYQAKEEGKARYALFDSNMHNRALQRLRTQTDLQRCIERGELRIFYQPLIKLTTGAIIGFEALLRWQHPQRGLLAPSEFVSVAEETGAIIAIGRWVLYEACQQLCTWQRQFPNAAALSMRINLSGKQFRQHTLDKEIDRVLQETGLTADRLHLEMPEKVIMEQVGLTTTTLGNLKDRGVQLCIDDFGTGYASLSYLHYFPIHSLKIDGSFVGRIGAGDKSTEIVRTIVSLARNLGMEVIAEGVETYEQERAIREMGCDYAQGFFYCNPLDGAGAHDLLSSQSDGACARTAN